MLGYPTYSDYVRAKELKATGGDGDAHMKDQESPILFNFTSLKHCIKRIHKSCQIQLEDYQWRNGANHPDFEERQSQLVQEVV